MWLPARFSLSAWAGSSTGFAGRQSDCVARGKPMRQGSRKERVGGRSFGILAAGALAALSGGSIVAHARHPRQSDANQVTNYNQLTSNNWAKDEHAITPENVGTLGVKWAFEANGAVSSTPVVVDGYVYVSDWGGYVHKLVAKTGAAVWSIRIDDAFAAGTGEP